MLITGSSPSVAASHHSQALASQEVSTQQKLSFPTTSGSSWNFGATPHWAGRGAGVLGRWGGDNEVTGRSSRESRRRQRSKSCKYPRGSSYPSPLWLSFLRYALCLHLCEKLLEGRVWVTLYFDLEN